MPEVILFNDEVHILKTNKPKRIGRPPKNPKELDEEITPEELEEITRLRVEIATEVLYEMLMEFCPVNKKEEIEGLKVVSTSELLRLLADKLEDK